MMDTFTAPVTKTTDEDDLLFRFLAAAEKRTQLYTSRVPMNPRDFKTTLSWLRGLVGYLNEDGSLNR